MLIPLLDSGCGVGCGVPSRLPPSEVVVLWRCVAVLVEAGGVVLVLWRCVAVLVEAGGVVLVEAGGVALVLLCCVLVDDAVLIETVGAGCTCKAASVITAHSGTALTDSCALMLVSVSAAAVLIACVDPLSCSMVILTSEVGANNLLAAVC